MQSIKKADLLISGQLALIVFSILFYIICNLNAIDINIGIECVKYMIVISFIAILSAIYLLKLGLLHIYSVFIMTVALYNASYVFLSLFEGNNLLFTTGGFAINAKFTEYIVFEYLNAILFFFLFVHMGALIAFKGDKNSIFNPWIYDKKMEFYGRFLFYLFLIPALYYYYEYLKQVFLAGGYKYKYGISISEVNLFIRTSDDLLKLGFYLILASKCKLSKIILPCTIFLIIQFTLSIITGSRVFFISQALFILVYLSMRIKIRIRDLILVLLLFISFSIFVRNLRATEDYNIEDATSNKSNSILDEIKESFILPQGASMHTVSLTTYLIDINRIEHSLLYFIPPLLKSTGYKEYYSENDYNFLADRLSFILIPKEFRSGGGLGSSIIAEFYAYGGIIFIIIFSMIYGYSVYYLNHIKYKSKNITLFFIIILPGLFYVGRAHPLYPIITTFKLFALYFILVKSGVLNQIRILINKKDVQ